MSRGADRKLAARNHDVARRSPLPYSPDLPTPEAAVARAKFRRGDAGVKALTIAGYSRARGGALTSAPDHAQARSGGSCARHQEAVAAAVCRVHALGKSRPGR